MHMSGKTVFNDVQVQERLKSARGRIVRGKTELAQLQKQLGCDGGLLEACDMGPSLVSVRARREYIGCSDRIASLCFAPSDSNRFATASHDGKLMVWDAQTGLKRGVVKLKSPFVMACSFEHADSGKLCATGGMDDCVTVYDTSRAVGAKDVNKPVCVLEGHEGYISGLEYLAVGKLLSTSGDGTCNLWDVSRGVPEVTCRDHVGDVLCVAVAPQHAPVYATGSVDSKVHVYDSRVGLVNSFMGQVGDVNALQFFPDGQAIASGCSDGSTTLFDLRAGQSLARYGDGGGSSSGIGGLGFSQSGRLLLTGSEDGFVRVWDTVPSQDVPGATAPRQVLKGHDLGITCLAVAPDGTGIITGSDDGTAKMWA